MYPSERFSLPPDPRALRVLQVWKGNGLKPGTRHNYSGWVHRFLADYQRRRLCSDAELTRAAVDRFARRHARRRQTDRVQCQAGARSALRAWAWGLAACGVSVPAWVTPCAPPAPPPILREFSEHRRIHRGVASSTLAGDLAELRSFFRFLHTRRRPVTHVRLTDVDAYVCEQRAHLARRTVARACSSIRAYLRFLHATGRLRHDVATSVLAPRYRASETPPRALPWAQVQAILKGIDRGTRIGRRDYALLLTMAVCGLGAAEARSLQLGDVEWTAGRIRVRRPKTAQELELPLLPAVARALAEYLAASRPPHTTSRALFVQMRAPFGPFTAASAMRHVLRKHAQAAGVVGVFLGSHALRHSHATRQIDLGVPPKLVGDILGHRSPSSTSAYVRVALRRLRPIALPVPQ